MEPPQPPQSDHGSDRTPPQINTLYPPHPPSRTANSTPVSSPGLFSPINPRATMSLPSSQSVSETTTPAAQHSPYLHPLQTTHTVRETHVANVDRDYTTGRKIINHYEVIEEIGRGVHGKVKLARDLHTNQNVAIKIVPRFSKKRRLGRITQNVSPFEKTKREIAILKKIRHPNVVALLEVIDDPDYKKIYLCLEHVECGEVIWRKKGLPHICAFERQRIEREMRGEVLTEEEEHYILNLERRYNLKELKRAHLAEKNGMQPGPWSLEFGQDDASRISETGGSDAEAAWSNSGSPAGRMSAPPSQPPSRTQSMRSMTGAEFEASPTSYDYEDNAETPGTFSTITPTHALDGTMYGAYDDMQFRERSPSMADSIISHMSSVDFNPHTHDPFADDFSYVPCFTIDEARRAFRDVVLGLQYLHYQGIVHRDIKPANLLWTKEHTVKISDFGVSYFGRPIRDFDLVDTVSESEAQDFDDELELSKTVGTPAFFAPELCYTDLDSGPPPRVSEKIDIWSLGVTLYCMIFARIPFLAEDEFQMFKKIATDQVYIPNRRLRPVDPSTSPKALAFSNREVRPPYRDDYALVYEDVDENLRDLLAKMLVKDPRNRIELRDIKRHPWILADMPNQVGWIDDTDPYRQTEGRKIQLTDKDLHDAVIPFTLIKRAGKKVETSFKKTLKYISGPFSDRTEEGSRKRATSSAASSVGESPALTPIIPGLRDGRRKSLRGDAEYFPPVREQHQLPQRDHPLTYSVTASPDETPPTVDASTSKNPMPPGHFSSQQGFETLATDSQGNEEAAERQTPTASRYEFPRRHRHSQSISNATLALKNNILEAHTAPTTPAIDAVDESSNGLSRKGRDVMGSVEDSARSQSVDRALVFNSHDKRASPKVAVSTFVAPGSFEQPKRLQQMRSLDLTGTAFDSPLPSPLLFSNQAIAAYHAVVQHKSETTLDKFQTVVKIDERPVTAHRVKDMEGKTPPPRNYNTSTAELEYEERINHQQQNLQPPAEIDPAKVPCPPSPDDDGFLAGQAIPREDTCSTKFSSKSNSGDAIATPWTSPSVMTSPVSYTTSASQKDFAEAVFQSDPSLPALLSGASSVSADPEGEPLGVPVRVNRSAALETTDSLTPPALVKEPDTGFPLEDATLDHSDQTAFQVDDLEPDSVTLSNATATPLGSRSTHDGDDTDSDDDGLLMMSRRSKKSNALKDSPKHIFRPRRRGTNASVGSTDTAKKILSPDE
ncbi:hypothetical protein M406DRAFT_36939 [Cryphonectria parasitica EP155]|uniref:non-specific serine/threonine protein kinase n=1 Tax=Cryphonectria parasitica (strain ATCC 38755 / EP155) TaxID=660469 RepID=A0A9P5CQB0_CRYP1|nr:uncharacterized protein M406DRAFT_36939 [Cryphonectria parasitica EP155]KAF3766056.1 hypothetical protein M406DRAFT_36939 [Cryphonectria parasitica EP155]